MPGGRPESRTLAVGVPSNVPRLAYDIDEGCAALGISRPTILDLIRAGRIRTVTIGRRRVIPLTELERSLADNASRGGRGAISPLMSGRSVPN